MEIILEDLENFLAHIPEDKKLIAKGLINELAFMQSILADLKRAIKKRGSPPENLKLYNRTVKEYGNLYKQLDLLLRYSKNSEGDNALKDWLEATK